MKLADWNDDRWIGQHADWGWVLGYGIFLAVIGCLALLQPIATGLATGLLVAFALISGGVLGVVAGFTARGWRSRWLDVAVGLLSLLLGFAVVWNPFLGAFSLVWAIGLWLVVCGGLEISAGLNPVLHRGWLLGLGVIDILLGFTLLIAGPSAALVILAAIVGVSFLLRGAFLSGFALRLRRQDR
jgi:uncharacterized membrane protein HdeD (DUF308 family)